MNDGKSKKLRKVMELNSLDTSSDADFIKRKGNHISAARTKVVRFEILLNKCFNENLPASF